MPLYSLDGTSPDLPPAGQYWVAPDAVLIGKVRLLRDANIWFHAVLRGDNEWITLGEGSNIQEACVLHTDMGFPLTIGKHCTIGHKAMLHGCTIGDNSLVGMGATILNKAVIPENCIVGAGALVTEGKTFEPGSLIVGVPAKAVRKLDDKALEMLKNSARHYVSKAKQFANGLKQVG